MATAQYLEALATRMAADNFAVSRVPLQSTTAVVGYQNRFRLRWFATRLHLFLVSGGLPEATAESVGGFMQEALEYGLDQQGQKRGLQKGVAIIPIAVSDDVRDDAVQMVTASPRKAFAVIATPIVVDGVTNMVYRYTGRTLWGGIYNAWLNERIATCLPGS